VTGPGRHWEHSTGAINDLREARPVRGGHGLAIRAEGDLVEVQGVSADPPQLLAGRGTLRPDRGARIRSTRLWPNGDWSVIVANGKGQEDPERRDVTPPSCCLRRCLRTR
jgi:hypothetical protein